MKPTKESRVDVKSAAKKAEKLGFGRSNYVLVVCMDRKKAKCCQAEAMVESWKHLKQRCKDLRRSNKDSVIRIKSACLDICKAGPIIGVLPDDVWYGYCTPNVIDRIIDEHLIGGSVVSEFVIAAK